MKLSRQRERCCLPDIYCGMMITEITIAFISYINHIKSTTYQDTRVAIIHKIESGSHSN